MAYYPTLPTIPAPAQVNDYTEQLNRLFGTDKLTLPSFGKTAYTPPTYTPPVMQSPLQYNNPSSPAVDYNLAKPVITPAPVAPKVQAAAPPAVGTGQSYVIQSGDTLGKIAARFGTTVQALAAANGIADPNRIYAGATIRIGGAAAPVVPPATPPVAPTVTPPAAPATPAAPAAPVDPNSPEAKIASLETTAYQKPSQTTEQLYSDAYASAGLADLKTRITSALAEVNADRTAASEALGSINENPFLTEKSRVGRGKRILDQLEQKIGNKLSAIQDLKDLYTQGVTEVNNLVARKTSDFGTDQSRDQAHLTYLLDQQEKKQNAAADANKAPTTIGSADTGIFRWDAGTKSFVQVIAPKPKDTPTSYQEWVLAGKPSTYAKWVQDKGDGGGAAAFKPTSDQKAIVGRFVNSDLSTDLGFTEADKARLATDSNFFYWTLQKATEAGVY